MLPLTGWMASVPSRAVNTTAPLQLTPLYEPEPVMIAPEMLSELLVMLRFDSPDAWPVCCTAWIKSCAVYPRCMAPPDSTSAVAHGSTDATARNGSSPELPRPLSPSTARV